MFRFFASSTRPVLAAAGLFCAWSVPFYAQNPAFIPDSILLRTVVIQTTRVSDRSAIPHNNYDAAQIGRSNQAQDVPMLLSAVPALVESSDAGNGVGYTGMRIRGSDPTRINVTINGIPLNDSESQGVYWVDLPDLAASAAEIQVQRGVGASTNGAGAFGATVNLDLSRIDPEPFAVISNTFGSFATRKHSAYIGTGLLGGKWAFTGRYSQIASDGYVDRASSNLRSGHFSGAYIDARQSLSAHILLGKEITYQAWDGLPAQFLAVDSLRTYNAAGTESPAEPYPDQTDNYSQNHFLLQYKREFAKGLSLQLNGHYTRGRGYYEQYKSAQPYAKYGLSGPEIGDSSIVETDLVRRLWLDNHFYGGTFALRWAPPVNPPALAGVPVFMLGGAVNRYEGGHYGDIAWAAFGVPKDYRYYDNQADKRDANIFGKIDLRFRGGIAAMLDMQYRRVHYSFLGFDRDRNPVTQVATLHFFNPKAGLNWKIGPHNTVYAFFGIGQREPNRDDYTQSTPESRPKPERLFDWEAGIRTQGANWNATLNGFWMYYHDQLVLDGRINDVGAYIRTNVSRSYRAGLELEASGHILPVILFRTSLAFSQNRVRKFTEYLDDWDTGGQVATLHENTRLAFSPGTVARAEFGWEIFQETRMQQLTFTLSGKYVGKQYLDNTSNDHAVLPAYFFTDLRLNYDLNGLAGKQLSLIFTLNNVWNTHYVSNGWVYRYISQGYDDRPYNPYTRLEGNGIYHQAGFFPQAGRNVMGTLVLRF